MISLSPLPSAHPNPFQRKLVRSSIACYGNFNLAKGRSQGFASAACNFSQLNTRFRFGSPAEQVILAAYAQLVGSLCKRHAVTPFGAPTACRRTVSGSIALPSYGSFSPFLHSTGSLSVFREYLALRDGPRGFRQDSSCPALLRCPLSLQHLPVRGCHPLRPDFPVCSGSIADLLLRILQPRRCRNNYGLGSARFARHYSGHRCFFLFLRVLRCFSSPGLPSFECRTFSTAGCPIRISPDLFPFADPRRFSQLSTSFFAFGSLGIPRTPLFSSFFLVNLLFADSSFFTSLSLSVCQSTPFFVLPLFLKRAAKI